MQFELNRKLKEDLDEIGNLELSRVFLMPNSENPWVILVPQVPNIVELHQLTMEQQYLLLEEVNLISKLLENNFEPDKINIGALGNMVPQLHIHIIARYKNDKAWPNALWGATLSCEQKIFQGIKDKVLKNLF